MKFDPKNIVDLAAEFSRILREWLGGVRMSEVNRRNQEETNPKGCHSHDFCDANMAMHEAGKISSCGMMTLRTRIMRISGMQLGSTL